jgi:hypothetical protein
MAVASVRPGIRVIPLVALALSAFAACGESPTRPRRDAGIGGDGGADGGLSSSCAPGGPARICLGNQEIQCNPDGSEAGRRNCTDVGQVCAPELGCAVCVPNRGTCSGNTVQRCRSDGSGYDDVATCDPALGQRCDPSAVACVSPCDQAARENSYIGCEYWPVTTSNSQLDGSVFGFAVVVSNPQSEPATVTVSRGGATIATRTLAPGALETIPLPWVEELRGTYMSERSALVRGGSYRLTSTLPVTVYQFNPLEYQAGSEFSYTNDASLLLPTHVLTPNYVVTSRATMQIERVVRDPLFGRENTTTITSASFFAVVATQNGTTVRITFRADVLASADGSVRAFRRGESGTFHLDAGDVLQILAGSPPRCDRSGGSDVPDPLTTIYYCRVTDQYDLTGTEIRASAPVAVTAGHNCAFVPYHRWACDHLEENLFPEDAWGTDAIVSVTQPLRGEPNLVRIISGRDGNALTFDPPSAHAPVTLHRGEILEFEARESFRVQATYAIQVAQFLVGQDYGGFMSGGSGGLGDPSMSLAIPTEQYRTSYAFLAPTTYAQSYVNIAAPTGATVMLDGTPVTGWMPVGSSGFSIARVPVRGGTHRIEGSQPFGIVVYGFGSYTSYMYPGGLDLNRINKPI